MLVIGWICPDCRVIAEPHSEFLEGTRFRSRIRGFTMPVRLLQVLNIEVAAAKKTMKLEHLFSYIC